MSYTKSYAPHVTFSYDDETKCIDDICFARIRIGGGVKKIKYYANVCHLLKVKEVDKWIEFITPLIGIQADHKREEKCVDFVVEYGNLDKIGVLMKLTFCRYIQEFPEIVSLFAEHCTGDLEKDFIIFQEQSLKARLQYYPNIGGHGFSMAYRGKSTDNITLKEFLDKLKSPQPTVIKYLCK